jgi:hypothetical protein
VFRAWVVRVTAGESLGFLAPAIAGAASAEVPPAAGVVLVLVAGGAEGAVLGFAQQSVLCRVLPGVRALRWTVLTAAAAVAAYVLGFAMSFLAETGSWLGIAGSAAAGLLLLTTLGGAQWLELRRHVPGAARWIGWTAVAWLAGLGAFLTIATPLWQPGQSTGTAIAVGVVAGVIMAAVQAAITGRGLLRLLPAVPERGDVGPCAPSSGRSTMKS